MRPSTTTRSTPTRRPLRTATAATALVIACAVSGPGVARANTYSRAAGFAQAKLSAASPSPIAVWKPPRWHIRLKEAIDLWNAQANRALFVRVWDASRADVVLQDGTGVGWAAACYDADGTYDMQAAYARCTIFVPYHGATSSSTWSLVHEMGHTLGFADHVVAAEYDRYVRWNLDPRVCDDRDHPAYSPYDGIMSECEPRDAFRGDAAALVRAGYAASVTA
jgi:hypothetical protein